ncbi:SLC13 family permease [Pseudactinotalea sp.]|uniref:SLC13 family permease n=1 Tax=Pseudactinotalea sp. TaxID=1926260 RepID=UPI003B3AD4CC
MPVEVVALSAFVVVFLLGTLRSVNMGAISLVAAFLVAAFVYDVEPDVVLDGFPGQMFVILVGVTFLFGIASINGTVEKLVQAAVVAVRGRTGLVPWTMFFVPAALTAVGAAAPAACAIVIPIALKFAAKHRINPVLMSMMVIQGTTAGGFSPIGIYGVIVNGIGDGAGLPTNPGLLFAGTFVTTFVLAAIAYVTLGGRQLMVQRTDTKTGQVVFPGGGAASTGGADLSSAASSRSAGDAPGATALETTDRSGDDEPLASRRLTTEQMCTLVGILGLVFMTLVFGLDVGFVSLTIAVVLSLIFTDSAQGAVAKVAWPTVLLICGIITYVSLLESQGTVDWLGSGIADIDAPLMAAIVILFIGALVSAFASTTAILGVVVPLATPFLLTDQIGVIPFIIALAVSSSVVDCSPLSTMGALGVANAEEAKRAQVFSGLMKWGMSLIVIAPIFTFLVLVWPSAA